MWCSLSLSTFLVKLSILPEFLLAWPATLVGFLVTQVGSLFRKLFPTPHQINEVNSVLAVYNAVYSISDYWDFGLVLSKCLSCWKSFHCKGSAPVLKSLVIYQQKLAPWKSLYNIGALCSNFLFIFGRHLCFYLLTPGSLANVPAKYARSRGCSFKRSERFYIVWFLQIACRVNIILFYLCCKIKYFSSKNKMNVIRRSLWMRISQIFCSQ